MSSCQSTGATSTTLAPVRSEDPAWAHARAVPGARNNTECLYCNKVIRGGGITRLKYHLAGIPGNVEACKKVSEDGQSQLSKGKGKSGESGTGKSVRELSRFFAPRTTPGAQPSIKSSMCSNEMFLQAKMVVARWWYDSNLPFNAAQSKFSQPAIDAMTAIRPRFKGHSLYELRGNLLKMAVNERQQSIINFLVYCPKGTMFLKFVDTSSLRKDAETLFNIFDEVVQEIRAENLVQFITNNDASYKAARKKLQQKYGSFYWSPCAAHCIDLMLENFSDPRYFPLIDDTIKKAKKITKFIYNHGWVLALMRQEFTKGHDLCHPAITRFATNFLSIQCLLLFKKELRQMFTCDKWIASSHSKSIIGKEIAGIVLEDKEFWAQCQFIVKISEPLVRVLRLVDGDEKPAMGYLYDTMERAKENIKARCNNKVSIFSPFTRIIDSRWDKQLHSPLHAAGFNSCVMKMALDPDDQDKIIEELDSYNNALQFGCEVPMLQRFAVRVLSQCCSATGCERNWSTFDFIHSNKRNRLVHKRLNDLVFVRYNLKLRERDALNPINLENIDLMEECVSEESELLDGEDLDWASIEEPLISLNEENVDNVDVDDGGDINENILINMSNLDPYCLFDEDE
ncbi:hypothetical protein CIPAW_03G065700 [Carya illinoinensis]|uniref:BED-type domain-containing protein n=1 Tax=Carya illinoinensis TaxID=32201 RepID=A0A8T1R111_CARIL|nr:hypothetical protein CIPAW_03G065700 [Carya illinoinensis]